MRENLRNFTYVLTTFLFTLGLAFFIINQILDQNYFVWFVAVMGLTTIFSVSYFFMIIERKI